MTEDTVRQTIETGETARRVRAVREHVQPPKNVSLDQLEALSFEEKATRMFPVFAEDVRRKSGLAPYAPPPRARSLDWWRK